LFNDIVFSARRQKKFTEVMLQQATIATQYFEAARMMALQPLMQ